MAKKSAKSTAPVAHVAPAKVEEATINFRKGDIVRHRVHGTIDLTVEDVSQNGENVKVVNNDHRIIDIRPREELKLLHGVGMEREIVG